ncbi:MAG: aldo/keto reductase [Candidatus Hydrogenedentes bacterium]|nr:aldo/keto reductase [Candidatus Hydrogenedentota bacterium]
MEKRKLGNTDMLVSVLGFGGAEIGFEGATENDVADLLNQALDAGLNVIDTAAGYMNSEEMIGKAVSGRRDDYYLFSKCGWSGNSSEEEWTPGTILSHIENSLKRLRTDRLDLIQLHSCSEPILRQGDVIAAVQHARDRGYARYIGYSGDGAAAKYAIGTGAFDTLQTSINIADQQVLRENLPMAHEKNMGVIAKRPIANAAWKTGAKPENAYHHVYWERLQVLQYDFLRLDIDTAVSVALRFSLSQPGVHTAIVGTKQPGRWKQNAGLLEAGPLSPSEIDAIRARWDEVADPDWVGQV